MPTVPPERQKPRKTPRQARSAATVEAIVDATIQVLLDRGAAHTTTTRVAERAGVSVGTMYQYYPNKQALFYALLERRLGGLAVAVETARHRLAGAPLADMAEGLANAFLEAQTERIDASRAIYRLAADLDAEALLVEILGRVRQAVTDLLASAPDARFDHLDAVARMVCAMLSGSIRTVLERADPEALDALRQELPVLCRAYLVAASSGLPRGG